MGDQLLRDRLTNFYTRDSFFYLFEDQLRKATLSKAKFSILITDINNFKRINDKYGHACGDAAIKFVAGIIRQIVKDQGFCGRYGGDELIILIPKANYKEIMLIAKEIYDTLLKNRLFFSEEGKKFMAPVRISIGVAVYPDDALDRNGLFIKADKALFTSKKRGAGPITAAAKINFARLKVALTAAMRVLLLGILLIVSGYFIKFKNLDRNLIAMFEAFKNPQIAEQRPDIIHLHNGSIIEGEILTETKHRVILNMKVGEGRARVYIDKKDIKEIKRTF